MARVSTFVVLLTFLISLSLTVGILVREQVKISGFRVRRSEGIITFPARRSLPPVLRGLTLVPEDDSYTATSPFLAVPGSATIEEDGSGSAIIRIAFNTPRIRIRLAAPEFSATFSFLVSGGATHAFRRPSGMRLQRSRRPSVRAGITAARRALRTGGLNLTLTAVVDHARNARAAGMRLADSAVVVFGNPIIGAPLWTRRPGVGVELPLDILVASSPLGVVYVGWSSSSLLRKRFGFGPMFNDVLDKMDVLVTQIAGRAAAREFMPPARRFDFSRISVGGLNITTTMTPGDAMEGFSNLVTAIEETEGVDIAFEVLNDNCAVTAGFDVAEGRTNRVAVFGNTAMGTTIMQQAFTAGIDLPFKMGVFDRRAGLSRYSVGYVTPAYIRRRHRVQIPEAVDAVLQRLANIARYQTEYPDSTGEATA